jgi:hypothetical protein
MEESHMTDPVEGWRKFVMEATAGGGLPPAPLTPTPLSVGFLGPPSFDPLDALPPLAAGKLRLLRQRAADAHAVIPEHEQIREASEAKTAAENALKRLVSHPQDWGQNLPLDHPSVVQAQRMVDKATSEFELIKQRSKDRAAAWQAASGALANTETWLKSGMPGGTTLLDYDCEPPKLNKGETVIDGIERYRRRCRELRADLHRIRSAPYPSSHAKAQMRAQIEQLAERGTPSVSRLIELDGPVDFQTQSLTSEVHTAQRSLAFTETADALALVAWLHRDALVAALDAEINTEADDAHALSHEARQQREAETMSDLLEIERQEAELCWRAQRENLPIEHRGDCAPLALLGLKLITPAHTTEIPGTTPGYSWPMRR